MLCNDNEVLIILMFVLSFNSDSRSVPIKTFNNKIFISTIIFPGADFRLFVYDSTKTSDCRGIFRRNYIPCVVNKSVSSIIDGLVLIYFARLLRTYSHVDHGFCDRGMHFLLIGL